MSTVYTEFVKPIELNKIQVDFLKTMDNYRNQQYIFNEIKPVLEDFAGKKITQRLITKLRATFPKFTFYLRWVGSTQCYLEVKWAEEHAPFNTISELSLFLGHVGYHSWAQGDSGKGYYTMDMIANNNVWLYNLDGIMKSMMLGYKELRELAEKWNKGLAIMQEVQKTANKFEHIGTYFKIQS
jgi:hypothetical protein